MSIVDESGLTNELMNRSPGSIKEEKQDVELLPLIYRVSEDTLVSILQCLRAIDLASCSETGKVLFTRSRIRRAALWQVIYVYNPYLTLSNSPMMKLPSPVPVLPSNSSGNNQIAQSFGLGHGPNRYGGNGPSPVATPVVQEGKGSRRKGRSRSGSVSSTQSNNSDEGIIIAGSPSQYAGSLGAAGSNFKGSSSTQAGSSPQMRTGDNTARVDSITDGLNDHSNSSFEQGSMCLDLLYSREIKSIIAAVTAPQPIQGMKGKNFWVSTNWISNARKYHEALPLPEVSYNSLMWLQHSQASLGVMGQGLGLPEVPVDNPRGGRNGPGSGINSKGNAAHGAAGVSQTIPIGIAYNTEENRTGTSPAHSGTLHGSSPQLLPPSPAQDASYLSSSPSTPLGTSPGYMHLAGSLSHMSASGISSTKKGNKARARRGSEALPPWPEINAELVCPHGSLTLTGNKAGAGMTSGSNTSNRPKKRLMAAKDWYLLRRFFPSGPEFRAKRLSPAPSGGQPLGVTIATAALGRSNDVNANTNAGDSSKAPAPNSQNRHQTDFGGDKGIDACPICLRESDALRSSAKIEQSNELKRRSEGLSPLLESLAARRSGIPGHMLRERGAVHRNGGLRTNSSSQPAEVSEVSEVSSGGQIGDLEVAAGDAVPGRLSLLAPAMLSSSSVIDGEASLDHGSHEHDGEKKTAPETQNNMELSREESFPSLKVEGPSGKLGDTYNIGDNNKHDSEDVNDDSVDEGRTFSVSSDTTSYAKMAHIAASREFASSLPGDKGGLKKSHETYHRANVGANPYRDTYEELMAFQIDQALNGDEDCSVLLSLAQAQDQLGASNESVEPAGSLTAGFVMDEEDFPSLDENALSSGNDLASKNALLKKMTGLPVSNLAGKVPGNDGQSQKIPHSLQDGTKESLLNTKNVSAINAPTEDIGRNGAREVSMDAPPSPRSAALIERLLVDDELHDNSTDRFASHSDPMSPSAPPGKAGDRQVTIPFVPGVYYLVPRVWLRQWRTYMREINAAPPPAVIECTRLLCHVHGLLVIPPHLEEYLVGARKSLLSQLGQYPGEVVEILSAEEWEELQSSTLLHNNQNSEFGVSFTVEEDGSVSWSTGVCNACDPYNHQTRSPHRRKEGHGAGYNTQVAYSGHNGTHIGSYHSQYQLTYNTNNSNNNSVGTNNHSIGTSSGRRRSSNSHTSNSPHIRGQSQTLRDANALSGGSSEPLAVGSSGYNSSSSYDYDSASVSLDLGAALAVAAADESKAQSLSNTANARSNKTSGRNQGSHGSGNSKSRNSSIPILSGTPPPLAEWSSASPSLYTRKDEHRRRKSSEGRRGGGYDRHLHEGHYDGSEPGNDGELIYIGGGVTVLAPNEEDQD